MANVLVGLFFVWVFITLVGHASWVGLAALYRALFGSEPTGPTPSESPSDDVVATHRVISRLAVAKIIAPDQARELRDQLEELSHGAWRVPEPQPETESDKQVSMADPPAPVSVTARLDAIAQANTPAPESVTPAPVTPTPSDSAAPHSPVAAMMPAPISSEAVAESESPAPAPPKVSLGEAIAEFLADHNIRWGELIAGLLIVVCSIGLVISLWTTLTETHRVVPSLIFLAGNASIFGAGLYTLFRWRLHETSRATLVIAMLLVPLGILAGLSTGGIGESSVMLNDPFTLAAIAAVGSVYLALIWTASRALVGRRCGLAMTIGLAGPATLLPLAPAALRAAEGAAAWGVLGGSAFVWLAVSWLILRDRFTINGVMPVNRAARRIMVLGVTTFSLAVLVGYVAFMTRAIEHAWLTAGLASLPGVIAIAALGTSLSSAVRAPRMSLFGSCVCVLGIFAATTMLLPSMDSPAWLWCWAATFSVSSIAAARLLDRERWTFLASLPISLVCLLTLPHLAAGVSWDEFPMWRRLVGGEAMLVSLALGVVHCVIGSSFGKTKHRRPLVSSGAGWLAYSTVLAAVLTVAPKDWMGTVPPYCLTGLLTFSLIGSVAATKRFWNRRLCDALAWGDRDDRRRLAIAIPTVAISTISLAVWVSVLKPDGVVPIAEWARSITLILFAAGTTCLVAAECLFDQRFVSKTIRMAATGLVSTGGLFALLLWDSEILIAAGIPVANVALLWWIGLSNRETLSLGLSRFFALVAAVTIGTHFYPEWLYGSQAWSSTAALWGWAAVVWTVAIVAWALHAATNASSALRSDSAVGWLASRSRWYEPAKQAWDRASLNLVVITALIATMIASVSGFALGLLAYLQVTFAIAPSIWMLPASLIAVAYGGTLWHRRQSGSGVIAWDAIQATQVCAAIVWVGWFAASQYFIDPTHQIVVATTVASLGCLTLGGIGHKRLPVRHSVAVSAGIGVAIAMVSSAVLLSGAWWPEVSELSSPDRFATLSVAGWWLSSAAALGWIGYRERDAWMATTSAILVHASCLVVAPLLFPTQWWAWFQIAAIASGLLVLAERQWGGWISDRSVFRDAVMLSRFLSITVGAITSAAVISGVVFDETGWSAVHGVIGTLASVVGVVLWFASGPQGESDASVASVVRWPAAISLLSGHAALVMSGWLPAGIEPDVILSVLWLFAATASIAEVWRLGSKAGMSFDAWHAGALLIATPVYWLIQGATSTEFAIGLTAATLGGTLVAVRSSVAQRGSQGVALRTRLATRGLGWFVLLSGAGLILRLGSVAFAGDLTVATCVIGWFGGWAVVWRLACPENAGEASRSPARGMLPDAEASVVVLLAMAVEVGLLLSSPSTVALRDVVIDGTLCTRVGIALAVVLTTAFRLNRRGALETGFYTASMAAAVVALRFAVDRSAEPAMQASVLSLAVASVLTVAVFTLRPTARLLNQIAKRWASTVRIEPSQPGDFERTHYVAALTRFSGLSTCLVMVIAVWAIAMHNLSEVVPLTICAVAMVAVALGELSEVTGRQRLRDATVAVGLVAIGMMASLRVAGAELPAVALSTRWFIAWVGVAGMLAFGLPKFLGSVALERWSLAIRRGFHATWLLAVGSLVATLVQEGLVRVNQRTDDLSDPLVVTMAGMLALLSAMSTAGAILSGPGFSFRDVWKLTDRQRMWLAVAAQLFGGLTWFHLFLCKNPLADLGLRAYWPYVVMALAFGSVGITQWASRRRDEVLAGTLRQTALYLPLIPVIGFWLSGSLVTSLFGESAGDPWSFIQGRVSYQALLVVAAGYYAVVSFLWKDGRTRIGSVLLGNAALWVALIQTPSWEFLSHPQAWIIPPAVCVLLLTHFHRQTLGSSAANHIRYAATLVIYVASTADMLIQGVGETLAGPMILVTLALLGTAAGVALKVRPFLYLGTTFVFIGVTSMVWHAQQQIDAVWPWWAFGITTGVLLLAGLMAIEKNKPKLRRIAHSMAQWEA